MITIQQNKDGHYTVYQEQPFRLAVGHVYRVRKMWICTNTHNYPMDICFDLGEVFKNFREIGNDEPPILQLYNYDYNDQTAEELKRIRGNGLGTEEISAQIDNSDSAG